MIHKTILLLLGVAAFATAAAKDPAPEGALLVLKETSHDFGDVPRKGGDLVHSFAYVNEGSAPLVLTRVLTSCSCLKAHFSKKPLAPGAAGEIRIVYEPHKGEPGSFHRVIQVYSNSADGRHMLTVQGSSYDERKK